MHAALGAILQAVGVSMLTLDASDNAVVLDDLLATGGSLEAAACAVERCGARVSSLFAYAEYRSDFGGLWRPCA